MPDNPFAGMTDKEMLIFNPNYHEFLKRLKAKEHMSSELARIIKQAPDNYAKIGGKLRKADKGGTAIYAYFRHQKEQQEQQEKKQSTSLLKNKMYGSSEQRTST